MSESLFVKVILRNKGFDILGFFSLYAYILCRYFINISRQGCLDCLDTVKAEYGTITVPLNYFMPYCTVRWTRCYSYITGENLAMEQLRDVKSIMHPISE